MRWAKESELPPLAEFQQQLLQWFETPLGQQLLEAQRQQLQQILPRLYGYHLMQISVVPQLDLTEQAPAGHRFRLVTQSADGLPDNCLVGEMENLPIASECVDAVLLHHCLDFAQSPHQVLREAIRVLRPGGRLVVIGFNPLSFWGLHRLWRKRKGQPPWLGHFISSGRMHDWLTLLEMKTESCSSGFYRPPWHSGRWMQRMSFCERWGQRSKSINGAFWLMNACKETYAATPVVRSWRRFVFPLPAANRVSRQSGAAAIRDKIAAQAAGERPHPKSHPRLHRALKQG